jgi:hypothetical protein
MDDTSSFSLLWLADALLYIKTKWVMISFIPCPYANFYSVYLTKPEEDLITYLKVRCQYLLQYEPKSKEKGIKILLLGQFVSLNHRVGFTVDCASCILVYFLNTLNPNIRSEGVDDKFRSKNMLQ